MSLRDPPYAPPSVSELQAFLLSDRKPTGHVNQVWPNLYIGNETCVCPLSDGCEPLCDLGPGLPHDRRGPEPAGGRGCRQAAQRHLPQPRLPAAAPQPRHEPGEGEEETTTGPNTVNTPRDTHKIIDISMHTHTHTHLYCCRGHLTQEEETPSLTELRQIFWTDRKPVTPVNQVWPNLYIGDGSVARDKTALSSLGVTHVLNAAAGRHRIHTGQQFYIDLGVEYHGVEAADHPEFDLRPFFRPAAQFIDSALKKNGRVFVHCAMGVSRSGALVLSYLMICQGLSLAEAIVSVRLNRDIGPNSGFLEQLRQLELSLRPQTSQNPQADETDMS
ncbi:dual specificity protein phosphatase 13-like isoform X4 [Hippoglossus stenolepis]|uniref:dual specificity protein phosphatase 13-like isoform X4 n=1 Tax=Hippoglossus stenolepis TaxID=195615 RepID=UPI001FAF8A1F|nr:dual specificity protein phosphatase 13-like isoform X4 [Hippoglossus stenolepis]